VAGTPKLKLQRIGEDDDSTGLLPWLHFDWSHSGLKGRRCQPDSR